MPHAPLRVVVVVGRGIHMPVLNKRGGGEGNYELDRTYDARAKSGRNAGFGLRDRAETSASPEMAQTPLEAVT